MSAEWSSNMNWLKTLWNWLVRKTSTSPKLAVVEDCCDDSECEAHEEIAEEPIAEVFLRVSRAAGVKNRDIDSTNAVALFEKWYTGKGIEEDVRAAIPDFLSETGGAVKAKYSPRFEK